MRIATATILKLATVALLALALVALIACGGSSSGSDGAASTDSAGAADHVEGDEHTDHAEMFVDPAGEERVINLSTENFKFVPDTVTVKVGETVRLWLENHDPVLHDYTTDEAEFIVLEESGAHHDHGDAAAMNDSDHEADPDAQVSLQPLHIAAEADNHGELVFKATEPGEYEFYCSVPGHKQAGMVGKIIIEE